MDDRAPSPAILIILGLVILGGLWIWENRPHWLPRINWRNRQPFGQRLYVGLITVGAGKLADEGFVEIGARCFNGTGKSIYVHRISGRVLATESKGGSSHELGPLPPPSLLEKPHYENVAPYKEFSVTLEQRIPKEIADKILSEGERVGFDFGEFDILVCAHGGRGKARLPLWGAVVLNKAPSLFSVSRVSIARVEPARLSISASAGQKR